MKEVDPHALFRANLQRLRELAAGIGPQLKWSLLALFAGVAVAVMLMVFHRPLEPVVVERQLRAVRVMAVQPGRENLVVHSQGTVQPHTETSLTSEVFGKVEWMAPALVAGGSFDEGELLLRMEESDYRNAVELARAALERARAELELEQAEMERQGKLLELKLASQSQWEKSDRSFRVARANTTEAQIRLQQAEMDLSRTRIYAPYKGRVRRESVDVGQFVSRGEVLADLYATDTLEVRLPIASGQFAYLDLSASTRGLIGEDLAPDVMIHGEYGGQGYSWPGRLVRTEAEIDQASRMFYGVASVRNPQPGDSLPPLVVGLFVRADIAGRVVDDVVRLPRSAMRGDSRVLVVDDQNRLRTRAVEVLRLDYDEVLIGGGLVRGERVCISPLDIVVEGMQVQPVDVTSGAAEPAATIDPGAPAPGGIPIGPAAGGAPP